MKGKRLTEGIFLALFFLACLPAAGVAMDRAELELDHALTTRFATPHTDWADPYVQGPVRVLFFTNGRDTRPRQCVELIQRFDMEAQAVFWTRIIDSTEEQWHGGKLGEERMLELLGQEWDCFVFFGLSPERMGAQAQYRLLEAVTQGAGLVLVGAEDARVLKPDNRLETPAFLRSIQGLRAYRVLAGRGAAVPWPQEIPYDMGWEVAYDYQVEQLGRLILWASGKEPRAGLELTLSPDGRLEYGGPGKVRVELQGDLRPDDRLELRVRGRLHPAQTLLSRVLGTGRSAEVDLPHLPAGDYHVDGWVRRSGAVVTWNSLPFTVVSARQVEGVDLDRDWGEIGERITGRVRLAGPGMEDEQVEVRLLDRRGRVLAVQEVKPPELRFDFPVESWFPMLVVVQARLLNRGGEVHQAHAYFNVPQRHHGQFNFVMWDVPRGTLAPYAEESLARTGVTVQLGGHPPRICAAYDVAWIPYMTRIQERLDPRGIMQPFCWNDEQAVSAAVDSTVQSYMDARRHGVFVWSLGDEVSTQGSCLSSHCAQAYHQYLRAQYGSLDALNDSWGTSFSSWDQVGLSEPEDNEEMGSLRRGNYPRWFDRRAFRSWNFVHLCDQYREAVEKIDPQARVGFEGAGRFDQGDDIDLIVRHNTFWSPYPGTVDEVIRSIAPREFPRANWMGYTKDAQSLLSNYWRMVTRGADAVWWWRWDAIGRFHGWLAPDLSPYPAVEEILEDTWFMRKGVGDLLLRYEMQDDRIALLFSYPSSFIGGVEHCASFGSYEDAHKAAHRLLRELGLQFRYVTDQMLRQGEFHADHYRVLVLPRAEAIGPDEARVIRRFVEQGGLVIADVRPGIFDHHLKPREQGVLDGLFGIRRTGRGPAAVVFDSAFGGEEMRVDPGVVLDGGRAGGKLDGHPVLIERRVGKGRAVLLNFDFSSYPNLSLPETDEAHADRIARWLAEAGVKPWLRVLDEEGNRQRDVEVTRWKKDGITVVSLFRESGDEASTARVELPDEFEVYQIRNQRALGRTRRFPARIIPCRAAFFAVLPAPGEVSLKLERSTVQRGEVVQARVQVDGADALHPLHVRAAVGRQELEWLDQNLLAGSDPVRFPVPVAYDDPVGRWRIEVTDIFTGRTGTAELTVR